MLSRLNPGILCITVFLPAFLAAQNTGPYLQLIETVPDKRSDSGWQVAVGSINLNMPGQYVAKFSWSAPPASMDASGATLSLSVAVQGLAGRINGATTVSGYGFEIDPGAKAEALAEPGKSNSKSAQARIRPARGLGEGQTVELRIGAAFGPGVTYRYRVSMRGGAGGVTGNTGTTGDPNRRLAATMECPASIVISALPSLNCHIIITGWRRNTSVPIDVSFPDELDTFGNHANGIQLIGRGNEDVFNWDEPRHSWGLFVFACPGQQGTGANCYGSVTTPSPPSKIVRIFVRQGTTQVEVPLIINAVARGGPTTSGGGGTTSSGSKGGTPPGGRGGTPTGGTTGTPTGGSRGTMGPSGISTEIDLDRPGLDFQNFEVAGTDPEPCRAACANNPTCRAFTFVKPGFQGPSARCYLKSGVPPSAARNCCISGVKAGAAPSRGGPSAPIAGNWSSTDGAQVSIILYNDGSVTIRYSHPSGHSGVMKGQWDGSTFTGNYESRDNAGATARGQQTLYLRDGRLEGPWVSSDGRRGTWTLNRR